LLQAQSVDVAIVGSKAGPFLWSYHAAIDLVASVDIADMEEVCMVGMVVPQGQVKEEEDGVSHDIEALFGDFGGDVAMPVTTNEQAALLTSFETTHREQVTHQFMAAEREALEAMLVVHVNMARRRCAWRLRRRHLGMRRAWQRRWLRRRRVWQRRQLGRQQQRPWQGR
jgi:hypothetical protein